jgi:hypothetical protein
VTRLGALLLFLPLLATAEKWTIFRQGPFSVATSAGDREAREALVTLVQLHHTLSDKFGKDLQPVWPLLLVQRKNNAEVAEPVLVRESYLAKAPAGPVPPQLLEAITLLLLRDATPAMDPSIEAGVARVFSTLAADGPRVTLGAPPLDRNAAWARMHLLLTDPRFSGSPSRVLLSNFAKGVDGDAAWRNTVNMLQRDFDKEAALHLSRAQFSTVALNGKPIDARRLRGEDLEPPEAALLDADLAPSADAYRAVARKFPELAPAKEALGVLTGDRALLEGATGPRALAALNTPEALEKAWRANERWPFPHELLAAHEDKLSNKAQRLRRAAELSPREVRLWQAAAEAFDAAELPAEAAKMWFGAERAALAPAEKARLRQVRLAANQKRVEAEEAERRRVQEAEARELQRLKDEAVTRIREAEARANAGASPSKGPVVDWWDGPRGDASLTGKLLRVDCLPNQRLRLAIGDSLKSATLLNVPDAGKIVVTGNGSVDLGCGLQKSPPTVTVEYIKATKNVTTISLAGRP